MQENEEVEAEVGERSAAVDKVLRNVTYLYVEHVSSPFTSSAMYTNFTKWEKRVIYKLQSSKLLRVFEFLTDFFAATLGVMKTKSPI